MTKVKNSDLQIFTLNLRVFSKKSIIKNIYLKLIKCILIVKYIFTVEILENKEIYKRI